MVKVDVRRDYYAELCIDSRAEPEEIRKQYRKLAFKYHPDRNPGRETEFNSKFQALQTAYEVLNDSQLRSKYDTDRIRAGYGKHYSSSRATATPRTQSSGTPFAPTPPRRTPTSTGNKSGYPPTGSYAPPPPTSGAQKWNNYTKPGASKWDKVYEDARTRAEAYHGFQNMKHNSHPAGGWTNFDPRTGRSSQEAGRTEKPPTAKAQQGQRPHSAYESYFNPQKQTAPQRSQTTKKRNGFAPGTPGGDEPMAKSTSAYASVSRGERAQASNPLFEQAPSPTKKKFTGDSNPSSMPNLERTSSRYATAGGEKTYVSSAGLGFTSSARTLFEDPGPRPRTNPPSPTATPVGGRHHSESPKLRPSRNHAFTSSPTSSDSDEILPTFRPKAKPRTRIRNKGNANAYTNYNKGYSSGDTSSAWAMHPDSWLFGETNNGHKKAPAKGNRGDFGGWGTDPNSFHDGIESDRSSRRKTAERASKSFKQFSSNADSDENARRETGVPASNEGRNPSSSNIFGAINVNEIHKTTPKSKSHDYINTSFSAKEWSGTFGDGVHFFTPASSSSSAFVSKTIPTRGRTLNKPGISSHFQPSDSSQTATNPSADRASSQPLPPFAEAKFSADHWAELLKNNEWTIPRPDAFQSQQMDSRRHKSPKKQSRPSKRHAVPRPATVTSEAEEAATMYASGVQTAENTMNGAAEAMDIDETIPSAGLQNIPTATPKEPTNSSNVRNPLASNTGPDLLDLTDIGLVNPFTATNSSGINDLKDLNTTLPFDSQPESIRTRIKPKDLSLPKPPKVPTAPKFTVNPGLPGMKPEQILARGMWDRFMTDMAAYMNEFNRFNRTMLSHFNSRQNSVDTLLSPNWMSARGDSNRLNLDGNQCPAAGDDEDESSDENSLSNTGKFGFTAYVRGMEEDFVVRQHWEIAWERHRQSILELGRLRAWIREGAKRQLGSNAESLI
ncbi:predicted protein [Uncinocarpus reesii 1704]|uniref:J domain-containing protein n=1 Tax=Uncinocarpus reesii (strain UAMH 1704) TaxID=336963 RepID=C4JYB3_UNCRE|nr:uncharacterized protein UREG_07164 [Uncinocarpus reesii 1704]EEP82299.1 predicted protein [Uncinocarpus reesii 1704]